MTDDRRADPDALLARVQAEEAKERRGTLKVFFGAAPGVGKTYAMLESARREKAAGRDVVIGILESHGRQETAALAEGVESLARRILPYRGKDLVEFDLDAALARKPGLLLVDELAHTNVEGSRHLKRWQDVFELLDAGIDVWTTLNVQHLESLNDVVAQITGVRVRETLPDDVLSRADEVELVDLPPDALLERLAEGKVYAPEAARRALEGFFRKGNLLALRELALRSTADRVGEDVQEYRERHGISATWAVADHVLVCAGPQKSGAALVRAGRRIAARLDARFTVAFVETPARGRLSDADRSRVAQTFRLAEELGADVVTLSGDRIADEILAWAHGQNVTRIVIGRPSRRRWRVAFSGSLVDELVRRSGDVDVIVTSGDSGDDPRPVHVRPGGRPGWRVYGVAAGLVALTTLAGLLLLQHLDLANFVMAYLLVVVFVAVRYGRGPSIMVSVLSVATFDFFFVPPRLTFAVSDVRHLFTFAVMLLVGLVISGLTVRVGEQAYAARRREKRSVALYWLTRELAKGGGTMGIAEAAIRSFGKVFEGRVAILLPGTDGRLAPAGTPGFPLDEREQGAAAWAFEHDEPSGLGTATLPSARAIYLTLSSGERAVGVLGMLPADPKRIEEPEERQLLATFCKQTAMALERAALAEEARGAERRAEKEELRNALLSSVSHDLRTPLAAITGAATTLLEDDAPSPAEKRDLLETIAEEATRLNRLVSNLLDITRLESGGLRVQREWTPLEEVIGSALARTERMLAGRPMAIDVPDDLPLVPIDGVLVEQLLVNLLENVARHTPDGTPVEISARRDGSAVAVTVADRGPGLPDGTEGRVFEKFWRAPGRSGAGTGLGLAIVHGIVTAHGGTIAALNRPEGGASFRFTLPIIGVAPPVPEEQS